MIPGPESTRDGRPPGEPAPGRRVIRAAIWVPGLAVALGAAVATAHGLYETALAARVPAGIAWLYPLITDGLALVAYAATARLHGSAARYAWSIVVLAAGLSGLAQAAYLAADASIAAPTALRFGVGAWPALAAAIVAHLLYLLATDDTTGECSPGSVHPSLNTPPYSGRSVHFDPPPRPAEEPEPAPPPAPGRPETERPATPARAGERPPAGPVEAPARDRARAAAARHAARHGDLPTVTALMDLAEVSRGTAAAALKTLREHGTPLHLVIDTTDTRTQP